MPLQPKRPKPKRVQRFGILNPYGDLWTHSTFETEHAAQMHVVIFWRGDKNVDVSKFRVVPVRVTVSVIAKPQSPKLLQSRNTT